MGCHLSSAPSAPPTAELCDEVLIRRRQPIWVDEISEGRAGDEVLDKEDELSPHFVLKNKASLEVVQALLLANPHAIRQKSGAGRFDKGGKLPLHTACEHQASLKVVLALIAAYPEATRQKDSYVRLPLHYACDGGASLEVVQALIATYPEAAREKTERDELPLHWACEKHASPEVVLALIALYPEAARKKEKAGWLPLHLALIKGASPDVVQALLAAYPEAAKERRVGTELWDKGGELPLHFACEHQAFLEVVRALIALYPEAVKEWDPKGRLALHSACKHQAPLELVQALIAAYPEAARKKDDRDCQLPLHYACQHHASVEAVQVLIAACPEAVKMKDGRGQLPLHCACEHHSPLEVVQALIALYPEAVRAKGKFESQLPLHCACEHQASVEVVQALIAAYPEAVRKKDSDRKLAYQLCTSHGALLGCVLADLPCMDAPSMDTAAAATDGEAVMREHSNTWNWLLDVGNDKKDEVKALVLPVVQSVLSLHPHYAHHLAHSKDEQGREAMSTTSDEVRRFLQSFLFFCGRYELEAGPAAHKSATAVVHFAMDRVDAVAVDNGGVRVALKFMANEDQFAREQAVRQGAGFDDGLVVCIHRVHSTVADALYKSSAARIGLSAYPHCLVMPAADRSLKGVIDSEHIAGRDWTAVRLIATQLVEAVGHVHDRGLVHGDLKPLNVMRVGAQIKLIDLDGAASFVSDPPEWAASKSSSAFLPPELLCIDAATDLVGVRRGCVAAHWSQDMWALGCVLYHLFAGEALFLANDEDDLTEEADKQRALGWASQLVLKDHRLSRISHTAARYLVSQLLSADPARRPSAQTVLAHSFFTGRQVGRMVGQEASFDVFISYRVDSDAALALAMHDKLSARGLRVWLDVKCLADGQDWEAGFCNGLIQSRCLLPILSKSAIKARFEQLHEQSACDNVLLEHRLATELQARGLVQRVFPLLVGELDAAGHYGDYFRQGCHPSPASSCCVASVEAKLRMHLESQGLGLPLKAAPSVRDVLGDITASQGGFVQGQGQDLDAILDALAERVAGMVSDLAAAPAAAANAPDDVDSLRAMLERERGEREQEREQERRRCAALEAVLRAHNLPSPP